MIFLSPYLVLFYYSNSSPDYYDYYYDDYDYWSDLIAWITPETVIDLSSIDLVISISIFVNYYYYYTNGNLNAWLTLLMTDGQFPWSKAN